MKSIRDGNQQRDHVTPFAHLKAFAIHPGTPSLQQSEFSWLKRASKEVDSTSTIFISWNITFDFHFRFWPCWLLEYILCRQISFSFKDSVFLHPSGGIYISAGDYIIRVNDVTDDITAFMEVSIGFSDDLKYDFFLWEGWVDLFIVVLGIRHLRSDQRRFFLKTLVTSLFFALLLDYVCLLSCLKPEESGPKRYSNLSTTRTGTWTLFQQLIFKLGIIISRFQPFVFLTWKVNKFSKASLFFWEGLKWRTAFLGCFPSPIICLASRRPFLRRCAPSRSCI